MRLRPSKWFERLETVANASWVHFHFYMENLHLDITLIWKTHETMCKQGLSHTISFFSVCPFQYACSKWHCFVISHLHYCKFAWLFQVFTLQWKYIIFHIISGFPVHVYTWEVESIVEAGIIPDCLGWCTFGVHLGGNVGNHESKWKQTDMWMKKMNKLTKRLHWTPMKSTRKL